MQYELFLKQQKCNSNVILYNIVIELTYILKASIIEKKYSLSPTDQYLKVEK